MGADHRAGALSEPLQVGPHERITVVREAPEILELEAAYDPGGPALRTAAFFATIARSRTPVGKIVAVVRFRSEFRVGRLPRG